VGRARIAPPSGLSGLSLNRLRNLGKAVVGEPCSGATSARERSTERATDSL